MEAEVSRGGESKLEAGRNVPTKLEIAVTVDCEAALSGAVCSKTAAADGMRAVSRSSSEGTG